MARSRLELTFCALSVAACAAPIETEDASELIVVGGDGDSTDSSGGTGIDGGDGTGGDVSTGGNVGTGGGDATGGGDVGTGGDTATGGDVGTGGDVSTGGDVGTGGAATGGTSTGGTATGGASTGGTSTGGASSGGTSTGGAATGGASTGGASTGGASTGGASTGGAGTGGAASTCVALSTGAVNVAEQWWAGDSEQTDSVVDGDNHGIADPTGIPGLDMWGGPTGWANVSYAFGPASECRDATGATSISVDVTSATAGDVRIALMTEASETSSNHWARLETFTAGETKTVVLNLDGSNLQSSWQPADASWDPAHLISVIAIPLAVDGSGLAPYDIWMGNVVVN